MKSHIALVGFMAAGKSTIGRKLARKLRIGFLDIDDLIVRDHGPIDEIFCRQGEPAFRRYEYQTIARVLDDEAAVLALGGGAVTYSPTRNLLRKRAYRVFIKVAPERILGRLRRSAAVRPLLGSQPSLSRINDLYASRFAAYANADLTIEATDLESAHIVNRIVAWMHEKNLVL